jgi:hypothetical protein
MASTEAPPPTHGDPPAAPTESEPLLGRPGDATQKPDAPMINNFFLGTGWIAQVGAVFLVGVIWSSVLTHQTHALVSPHPLLQSLGVYTVLQAILILQPTTTPAAKFLGQRAHFFIVSLPPTRIYHPAPQLIPTSYDRSTSSPYPSSSPARP